MTGDCHAGICGSRGLQCPRPPDNVEAEGSSPFTSTKGPGQRPKVGSPKVTSFDDVSLRVFTGHMTSGSGPFGGPVTVLKGRSGAHGSRGVAEPLT